MSKVFLQYQQKKPKIKKLLPSLISCNQVAQVENRFISGVGGVVSDILETTDIFKIKGFALAIEIEKVFEHGSRLFIFNVLKKFGFEKSLRFIEGLLLVT